MFPLCFFGHFLLDSRVERTRGETNEEERDRFELEGRKRREKMIISVREEDCERGRERVRRR